MSNEAGYPRVSDTCDMKSWKKWDGAASDQADDVK